VHYITAGEGQPQVTLDAWSERLDSMEREGEEENGIDAIFISNLVA